MKEIYKISILFLFVFSARFASATTMDITKSKAQSSYIMQGGSFQNLGDIPATVDSIIHMGTPFKTGMRVYCTEDSTNYIARGSIWNPIKYIRPDDTAAMLGPYALTATVNASLSGKFNSPTGTTSQYIRGDGSLATYSPGTVTSVGITSSDFSISGSPVTASGNITANLNTSGVTAGIYNVLTVNSKGIVTSGSNYTFNNAPSRSIVTTAAAANGWQISASTPAFVTYSVTISTTVSLSGNAVGYVVLEVAATNSTTASDWKEIGRVSSGQSGTLVIGLTLNQTGGGSLYGVVPMGWYTRLRSVNTSGTPTYTLNSGQETY